MSDKREALALAPLFEGVSAPPPNARGLIFRECETGTARECVRAWHSRMPVTQRGPWQRAFVGEFRGTAWVAALLHNPSARTLPSHWVELRRLAVADDAPHCTATWMLGQIARWYAKNEPHRERIISYQDTAVHRGTIYRAAGWTEAHRTKARQRNRETNRPSGRFYRSDDNGKPAHASEKVRWEKRLRQEDADG